MLVALLWCCWHAALGLGCVFYGMMVDVVLGLSGLIGSWGWLLALCLIGSGLSGATGACCWCVFWMR